MVVTDRESVKTPGVTPEDLVIDIADLLAVLGNWGEAGGDCNGDGTTDITDEIPRDVGVVASAERR